MDISRSATSESNLCDTYIKKELQPLPPPPLHVRKKKEEEEENGRGIRWKSLQRSRYPHDPRLFVVPIYIGKQTSRAGQNGHYVNHKTKEMIKYPEETLYHDKVFNGIR